MAAIFAYLFPGQGAQAVGMGRDLYEGVPAARAVFDEADETLGYSLSRLCFDGPEADLRSTLNTQPAIFTTSIACLRAAEALGVLSSTQRPAYVAGHSLGEYTALVAAEVLSFSQALGLVQERARQMEAAGQATPGGMAAILNLSEDALQDICKEADVEVANINSPDQVVISGTKQGVALAVELATARGARRAIPLEVGGAFHSRLMAPAGQGLARAVAEVPFADARMPIIANSTASPITAGDELRDELVRQLCAPVLWRQSIEQMVALGVQEFIEIGPGRVLTGLVKRIDNSVQTRNLNDLASLQGGK